MTYAKLRATSPRPTQLRTVLFDEERRGRVERQGDEWRIVPSAFPADLLEAIGTLDGFRIPEGRRVGPPATGPAS